VAGKARLAVSKTDFKACQRMAGMENDGGLAVVDGVEAAIRQAAGKQEVLMIRLAIGTEVSVPQSVLASELHKRFPRASIEMKQSKITDSVVVKDIEVE
jgi:hypothetical protein